MPWRPGLGVLIILALLAAFLLVFNLFRPGMQGFVVTLIGLGSASPILGDIYPGMVQRYVVEPNGLERGATFHRAPHSGDFGRLWPGGCGRAGSIRGCRP